jgi:hypothetical protein
MLMFEEIEEKNFHHRVWGRGKIPFQHPVVTCFICGSFFPSPLEEKNFHHRVHRGHRAREKVHFSSLYELCVLCGEKIFFYILPQLCCDPLHPVFPSYRSGGL